MSRSCKEIESALLAAVDGRASAGERDRVAVHVAGCATCARRLEDLRGVWTSLDALEAVEPSPAFDARLRERLEAGSRASLWPAWFPARARWAGLTLAMAAAAVALWFSVRPLRHRPAPASVENPADFAVVKNLPVLENYDLLSNFDALSALPGAQTAAPEEQQPVD